MHCSYLKLCYWVHLTLLIALLFLLTIPVYTQEQLDTTVYIDGLKTPSSPAFTILGISPTAIERPQTPKAFALSIVENVQEGGHLPGNFALDIAPYWIVPAKKLTFDKYFNPTLGQSSLQNLTFSLATSKGSVDSVGTFLSAGLRTILISGRPGGKVNELQYSAAYIQNKYIRKAMKDHLMVFILSRDYNNLTNLRRNLDTLEERLIANPTIFDGIPPENVGSAVESSFSLIRSKLEGKQAETQEEVELLLNEISSEIEGLVEKELSKLAREFQEASKQRIGFILEMAGAVASHYPMNSIDSGNVAGYAVWLTPMYSWKNFDLIGVFRYLRVENYHESYIDVGLRINVRYGDVGVSVENLFRNQGDNRNQYSINLDYKIKDGLYLTGTFGKQHDQAILSDTGNLIAILGINFGLGSNPIIPLGK